jgi:hypothetical protein
MKIRLQSVGMVNAIPAEEMRAGDIRMFNFGVTELIVKIIEKSEKTLTVISYNNDNGQYYIYDIRKTTPVAIIKRDQDVSIHKPQYAEKVSGKNKGVVDVSEYFKDNQQEINQETQEQPQQMDNTATKKQRYALYIASNRKIDTRNIIISKEKASELISRSMQGEDITSELQAIAEGNQTKTVTEQLEVKQENKRQGTLVDAYNTHKSLIDLIATNRPFNDALRMTDLKPYIVTLQNAYYDIKENNKHSFVQPIDVHNAVNILMNSELFHALKSEYVTESEYDNRQQAEKQLQTENKEQPQKIKVKSITFLWSESPVIKENTTVNTWAEANKIIKDVAFRVDKGYDKTAFYIEWEDGKTYKGRIDVMAKDYYKETPLSEHIENFALCMAGLKKPYNWTNEEYESYLNGLNVDREAWKNFLNTYMLYDEETPKSPHDPYDHVGNNRDNGEFTIIVTEETQLLQEEVLFYHEALTETQNAKINEILNRHKDSNKFTFVAVYQRQNEAKQAVLHVLDENKKDLYLSILLDGTVAFSERYLGFFDRDIKLLHEFTNNSDNVQTSSNGQEEKAVNDAMQEAENSNNTLVNESPKDLQVNNAHNNESAQTLQFTYKINDEKNGIELYFSEKPSETIREQLKQYGFKWSPIRSIWYAKKTDERLEFVQSLMSESYNNKLTDEQRKTLEKRLKKENVQPLRLFKAKNSDSILLECLNTNLTDQKPFYFLIRANGEEIGMGYNDEMLNDYVLIYTYTHNSQEVSEWRAYQDINIDDIDTYVIDERLQEAEHAASWIFRTQKRDHTKEIQEFFTQYNNQVKELLEQTDNERIKYYLKKSLQSFKKRYFDNYVKRLKNKADNPSIWVTGRSGRNISRYNKLLNRYDKLMQEAIELTKQMDRAIERAKDEIRRDQEQRIKEAVKNVNNDLTFTVMTKEIEYMGYKERKRVYVYGDYWTARLWGCFRIFKHNKEIHEMKSTDKLEDAKRYIAYLIQQEQEKAKNVITA